MEFEDCEQTLPNLYTLRGEPHTEKWILLQDLSNLLKIKSRDTLLKQISPCPPVSGSPPNHRNIVREVKMTDFLEQTRCCQYLCSGERINMRSTKIALVRYSDKVRQLLGIEKITVTAR